MPVPAPPSDALTALLDGFVRVTRRCEVLDSAGSIFYDDIGLLGGSVTVDASRDERRMLDITLFDDAGRVEQSPDTLWYDKLIRPWRGITWSGGSWEAPLGTFMIDTISDATRIKPRRRSREFLEEIIDDPEVPFALSVDVVGRDLTKRMLTSWFTGTTTFIAGTSLDVIILALAANSGIVNVILPWTDTNLAPVLELDQTYDADSSRWAAVQQLCLDHGYEAFFDAYGFLIVRVFQDPATLAPSLVFTTGSEAGNLASYKKTSTDADLKNHIVVRGSSSENGNVFGEALITDTSSPIHADRIGDRTISYPSAVVTTNAQAIALAKRFLSVAALQSYQVDMGAVVMPWLEAGEVVSFVDLDAPTTTDPTSFFLSNFTIPLTLDPMDATAKRLLAVG